MKAAFPCLPANSDPSISPQVPASPSRGSGTKIQSSRMSRCVSFKATSTPGNAIDLALVLNFSSLVIHLFSFSHLLSLLSSLASSFASSSLFPPPSAQIPKPQWLPQQRPSPAKRSATTPPKTPSGASSTTLSTTSPTSSTPTPAARACSSKSPARTPPQPSTTSTATRSFPAMKTSPSAPSRARSPKSSPPSLATSARSPTPSPCG